MKNGEITVRFAAENELARVNELRGSVSRLHAENRPDVFCPDFCNELRQIAKNAFDADDSDVVVACMDGDICGFAIPEYIERQESCCRRVEKFCRISEFGVDAALRRRGAASAMIDFCRTEAKNVSLKVKGLNRMYGVLTGTPFGSTKPQDLKHTGNIWR